MKNSWDEKFMAGRKRFGDWMVGCVRDSPLQLKHIEGEADKLMIESLQQLYNGDYSSLRVVILKDLYELLEKIFDRCRDVGNVVFQIVLKHS